MAATTDFKSLFAAIRPLLLAPSTAEERFGVMMRARHGVGKSQVVYQTADAIYWDTQEQRLGYKSDGVFDADTDASFGGVVGDLQYRFAKMRQSRRVLAGDDIGGLDVKAGRLVQRRPAVVEAGLATGGACAVEGGPVIHVEGHREAG